MNSAQSVSKQSDAMAWHEKISRRLDEMAANWSRLSRELGWRPSRLHEIVKCQNLPNAIDAVRLCGRLGLDTNDVFSADHAKSKTERRTTRARSPGRLR